MATDGQRGDTPITEYWSAYDYTEWNPLIDDGDTLRLAVKLQKYYVEIKLGKDNNLVGCGIGPYWCEETTVDNPEAATRRAIVRAAAEIGKQK